MATARDLRKVSVDQMLYLWGRAYYNWPGSPHNASRLALAYEQLIRTGTLNTVTRDGKIAALAHADQS